MQMKVNEPWFEIQLVSFTESLLPLCPLNNTQNTPQLLTREFFKVWSWIISLSIINFAGGRASRKMTSYSQKFSVTAQTFYIITGSVFLAGQLYSHKPTTPKLDLKQSIIEYKTLLPKLFRKVKLVVPPPPRCHKHG